MVDTKNIPNKTIAILIIVALLVTIISTWVVLLKIDSLQMAQTKSESSINVGTGNLAVTILPNKEKELGTGHISINVVPLQ